MTYNPIITSSRISKGYGYSCGGDTSVYNDNVMSAVVEKYDDVADTWATKMPLGTATHWTAPFSLNSYGYICGGGITTSIIETDVTNKYDNILNIWTIKASLNTAREKFAGFPLSGYGYTAGGYIAAASAITEKYDDILNTWTTETSMTTAREQHEGFSLSGYGYTAGGYIAAASAITEKYDDILNTWTTETSMTTARKDIGSGLSLNGYGYAAAGYLTATTTNINEKYDNLNNTWTTKKNTNNNMRASAAFTLNGYCYLVGGYITPNPSTITEKYDDILNTWTAKTSMTTGRYAPSGFSIGNLSQSIQNPDIQEIIEANRRLRANEVMVTKAASANARNTHDAEVTTTSADYTKKKTMTAAKGIIGVYRVKFELHTSDITKTAYGKLYKNGVAIGTEKSSASLAYVAVETEDITNSLSPGDTLELWIHNDGAGTTSAKNFRLCYDDAPVIATPSSNS